jgi:hypothetical protein
MKPGDLVLVFDAYHSRKPKMMGIILPSKEQRVLVTSQRRILLSSGEITWRNMWELEPIEGA